MSAADPAVFRRAAQVIREDGLAKGSFTNSAGEHCTVGALRMADPDANYLTHGGPPEISLLGEMLGATLTTAVDRDMGVDWCDIAYWNDRPERTAEDVITLLEQAAEKLETDSA